MNKKISILMILLIPVILSLVEWGLSFSTTFIIVSMILIYILIIGKEIVYKSKFMKKIYKIYKVLMILLITSFILLQSAIIINMYKTRSINNVNNKVNTMIILGATVNEKGVSKTLKQRLDKGIEYYNKNQGINIIVSGGQDKNEPTTEASAMKKYLVDNGVDKYKIILEDKATTTLENILFSKRIMQDLNLGSKALIVTSDYHLFRGRFIAKILGIDNEGLCSKSSISGRLYYMIREYSTSIIDLYKSIKIRVYSQV